MAAGGGGSKKQKILDEVEICLEISGKELAIVAETAVVLKKKNRFDQCSTCLANDYYCSSEKCVYKKGLASKVRYDDDDDYMSYDYSRDRPYEHQPEYEYYPSVSDVLFVSMQSKRSTVADIWYFRNVPEPLHNSGSFIFDLFEIKEPWTIKTEITSTCTVCMTFQKFEVIKTDAVDFEEHKDKFDIFEHIFQLKKKLRERCTEYNEFMLHCARDFKSIPVMKKDKKDPTLAIVEFCKTTYDKPVTTAIAKIVRNSRNLDESEDIAVDFICKCAKWFLYNSHLPREIKYVAPK